MPFEVTDNQTGKVITFDKQPTDADIQEAFGIARGANPTAQNGTPDYIKNMSTPEKFLTGVGKGMYDLYKGVQQKGAQLGNLVGIVDDSTVKRITKEGQDSQDLYAPLGKESLAARIGEFTGGVVPTLPIPGGVAGGILKRLGTSALAGGAMGAAQFTPEGGSTLANTLLGAGGGALGSAALSGAGKVVNAARGKAKTPVSDLAEKLGIRTTLGEETGNPVTQKVETWLESVPSVLGLGGFRKKQRQEAENASRNLLAKYMVDPTSANPQKANEDFVNNLYESMKQNARVGNVKIPAADTKTAALDLIDRYPAVFESIQDTRTKGILKNIIGDTKDVVKKSPLLDAQGNPITSVQTPTFDFDTLWELRKGVGQAAKDARTDTATGVLNRIYAAVTNDMDTLFSKTNTPAGQMFREANDAFKQYKVKYDLVQKAFDIAVGERGGLEAFSPKRLSTLLKNIAYEQKDKTLFRPGEIEEMTGLANILQTVKRAGQYMENPPTGNRWGPLAILTGGLGYAGGIKGAAAAITPIAVARFLTGTKAGKNLALAASKVEADSPAMQTIVNQIYQQLPKFAAQAGITLGEE